MTQDAPDAPTLLAAAAEFLAAGAAGAVPRELRFQVLVAANACAVVARELAAGDRPLREDWLLFDELLGREDGEPPAAREALETEVREMQAALSARISQGREDERLEELAARLAEHVGRKVAIARPGYEEG